MAPHEEWQEAIASIADPQECPMYNGLKVKPVKGLYPIGRDPDSQLWEFVHVLTGSVPERADDGSLILPKETGLVLVLIPSGKFLMGAEKPSEDKPQGSPNVDPLAESSSDGPIHKVILSAFFMGKYEVRQCEWERVMGENPSAFKGDSLPVETVSWYESRQFCEKLGLALPTEARWEYACRAGTTTPYAGTGNLDEMGWYDANGGDITHPIGEKQPNHYGLHDMHGNVNEWCEDVYDGKFYLKPEASRRDPICTSGSEFRVYRGGSWLYPPRFCRSASRLRFAPSFRDYILGFRAARPCLP